jgi:hypothetical protein
MSGGETRAVVTYDDTNAVGVDWFSYNKSTNTWTHEIDCTTLCNSQPASGDDELHRIRQNPFNSEEIMALFVDRNNDLFSKRLIFNGSTFTWISNEPGSAALEATISSVTGFAADFAYNRFVPVITTLATGSDPGAITIAPGAAATDVDFFTLQTNIGAEGIASVTVNLSTNNGIGLLAVTDNANAVLGSTASPVTGANTIIVSGMSAGTSPTTFKIRATPLSHAAMPTVPGAGYAVTAPVTLWTGSAPIHTGSDTNVSALTIDNLSPLGATLVSGTTGNAQVTLGWTTSASADFSRSTVLRWIGSSAGSEVPTEGIDYVNTDTISTATIVCVRTLDSASVAVSGVDGAGTGGCSATTLTNGQAYSYKVFQKDINGNYDVGVLLGTFTPVGPGALPVSGILVSGVFDTTGSIDGVAFNSILWNGTTIGTGGVRFQLATADMSTGPWNYYGGSSGTCNAGDWFDSGAMNTPVEFKGTGCAGYFNNRRYYRYKIQICSAANCTDVGGTSPVVNTIIVNWSP